MSEYGLDYAMHRHDIEQILSVEIQDINPKLAIGWKPLHMASHEHGTSVAMGVPRPKECLRHTGEIKEYYLRDDKWHCKKCLMEQD